MIFRDQIGRKTGERNNSKCVSRAACRIARVKGCVESLIRAPTNPQAQSHEYERLGNIRAFQTDTNISRGHPERTHERMLYRTDANRNKRDDE